MPEPTVAPRVPLAPSGMPRPKTERIIRATLHDEVVARLRDMIVEGELAAGTRVPERILCERFGISRTPLREALKVLASEGLVELMPNRGANVAALTDADIDAMFPVMGALEALAGELACRNVTEEDLEEIRALHYQMVLHFRKGMLPEYFRLNQEIHERIVAIAANSTLANVYRGLSIRLRPVRFRANMSPTRWAQAVAEHGAILEALEKRDGPLLSQILKQHLENKRQTVREARQADQK